MTDLRVFICYAFVDEQHPDYIFAQRLAEDLRKAGADVVVDTANVGEQAFVQRLNRVLPSCQWLIVVQTPAALQSLRMQMSVSSALNLVSQKKMQKVLAVIATPCEMHDIPLTWESLTVFDASKDYARALARVLLELELQCPQTDSGDGVLASADIISLADDNPLKVPVLLPSAPLPVDVVQTPTNGEDRSLALSVKSNSRGKRAPSHTDQYDRSVSLPEDSSDKKSKNSLRRYKRWVVVTSVALLLILITSGTGILYSRRSLPTLPTASRQPFSPVNARVTITPLSSELKNTFDITAVTGTPDASNRQVTERILSSTLASQTQTAQATGAETIPGTHASGTVAIDNFDTASSLTLTAGSVFSNTYGTANIHMVLDASVTVPPAPSSTVWSQRLAPGHILEAGTIGNKEFNNNISGSMSWSVFNSPPFSNGKDPQTYTVVQQSDIDSTANALEQANAPNSQQVIQPLVHANERLVSTPQCNPNVNSNHQAGDKATSVTVTVSFTCTGEVFDHDTSMTLAANLLNAQASNKLGPGFALVGKITTKLTNVTSQGAQQKGIGLTIAAQGLWVYQFSDAQKQAFAKLIIGKGKKEANELLLTQAGVAKVDIQITGGTRDSLPFDVSRVNIIVSSISQPSS
jgi:hypothetical protein